MRKVLFWIGFSLLLFIYNWASGQSVTLYGATNVCPNSATDYSFGVDGTTCYYIGLNWTVVGGTILSEEGNGASVIWDETDETHSISIHLSFSKECAIYIPPDNLNITVQSILSPIQDEMGEISVYTDNKYDIITTRLSECDTYYLKCKQVTDLRPNEVYYYWRYKTDEMPSYESLPTTTSNMTSVDLSKLILSGAKEIWFSVTIYSSCSSIARTAETKSTHEITYCYELSSDTEMPACYGYSNSEITLKGFPNPALMPTYPYLSNSDIDSFDISIAKYYKAPLNEPGDPYCSNTWANGNAVVPEKFDGYEDEYCPSGYTSNYTFKYTTDSVVLDENNITLYSYELDTIGCDSIFFYKPGEKPIFIGCGDYILDTVPGDSIMGLDTGLYVLDIENPVFTKNQTVFEVNAPSQLIFNSADGIEVDNSIYHVTTPTAGDGEIKLSISGGTIPYKYNDEEILKVDGDYTISGFGAGEHSIVITDFHDCNSYPDSKSVTLLAPGTLKIDTTGIKTVSCNTSDYGIYSDGVITFDISGGIGPYFVYLFKDSESEPLGSIDITSNNKYFQELKAGDYKLVVRDNDDAIAGYSDKIPYQLDTLGITVDQPDSIHILFSDIIDPVCSPVADGEIRISASGGTPAYDEFVLCDNDKDSIRYTSTDIMDGLQANTTYYIKVKDYNECYQFKEFISGNYSTPLRFDTQELIPEVCLGGADGSILFYAYGGHYDINNFDSTNFEFAADFENYYNENFINEADTLIRLENLYSDSLYVIQLEDKHGCITEDTVFVTGYSSPLGFTKGQRTPPDCIGGNDGSITLQGFGGHKDDGIYDDSYFTLDDYTVAGFSTLLPAVTITELYGDTVYTVTIDDKEGCSETDTIYLGEEPNHVQPLMVDSAEERCYDYNDGWIKVTGTSGEKPLAGYSYFITDQNQFSYNPSDAIDTSRVKTGNESSFYNMVPGSYFVYVSDENDCLNENREANRNAYRKEFYVEPQDLIQYEYELHNSSTIGAEDGYVKVTISGGNDRYQYQLIDKLSMAIVESGETGVGTSPAIGALKEGDYTLQIKDTCGCSNSSLEWINYDFTVLDPADSLKMDILQINRPSCYGYSDGEIVVEGKFGWGNYIYGIDSAYNDNTEGIITGLSSGTYTICVKDDEGAQYCTEIYVGQPDTLLPAIEQITDVRCHNESDGMITVAATGGTMPYYYSADNITWQQDSELSGFSKGNYMLYVKDANGCEVSTEAEVGEPDAFTMNYSITNTVCGEASGEISCTITGATSPYTCSWFMIDAEGEHPVLTTSSSASNLYGGKYKLIVNDSHFCDSSWIFIVNNTDGPQLVIESTDSISCSGMTDGEITYSVSQGIAPYYAELQSGNNVIATDAHSVPGTFTFNGLSEGVYRIMVHDANGCVQSSNELVVGVPNPVTILVDEINDPVCYGYSNGNIAVHAEGGNGNYIYNWNTGKTENRIDNLSSGTYMVTATDSKGCYTSSSYELNDPEKLAVEIGDKVTLCEGQNYPLAAEGYTTYNWLYNGEYISSSSEIEIWAEGEYILQVTDVKGCMAQDTFILVLSNDLLEAEFIMPSEALVSDTVVAIDISWPEPQNVIWSFSDGIKNISSEKYIEEFTFETPGIYTVSLTSYIAMCVDSVSKQIEVLADTTNTEKSLLGSNELIRNVKIYPNPNNGAFSVQVELEHVTGITVDIYSMQQNRTVFRQKGNGQLFYNMECGFKNLQQGIYLVIIYAENERRTERLLIL
ncbi:MAG: hypothetical protein A2X13_15455 [Bacteroidetes bacterium GWC2_33_15]|nr:MAG: hypothetical protein A2X10_04740 [Bacteroidetes bacterium GWA2_33_15]OFX49900.1 MAG: hypothetical protein A2X13_15455 [Bacteroidetes bacterium GWC2_33_15]OFX66208.1 MAG: hypothetical protein A2X15_07030 [Bacteroidetes bacterium GWB2_32_14]OFX70078.1 MAG: hypothetical protein A2X14_05705 [Bacteroidetes bacterium GWD2_33_33]